MSTAGITRDSDIEHAAIQFWASAALLYEVCVGKGISNTVAQTFITAAENFVGNSSPGGQPNSVVITMASQVSNTSGGSWT